MIWKHVDHDHFHFFPFIVLLTHRFAYFPWIYELHEQTSWTFGYKTTLNEGNGAGPLARALDELMAGITKSHPGDMQDESILTVCQLQMVIFNVSCTICLVWCQGHMQDEKVKEQAVVADWDTKDKCQCLQSAIATRIYYRKQFYGRYLQSINNGISE